MKIYTEKQDKHIKYIADNKVNSRLIMSTIIAAAVILIIVPSFPTFDIFIQKFIYYLKYDYEFIFLIFFIMFFLLLPFLMFLQNKFIVTDSLIILKLLRGKIEIPIEQITYIRIVEHFGSKYTQIETKENVFGYPFPVNITEIKQNIEHINNDIKYW